MYICDMKKIFQLFWLVVAAIAGLTQTACKENNGSDSGQPVITHVRVCDPEKADSTFVKSSQGQVIAIMGENLNNTLYVYINDQKVYFNPMFNTDHNILVTVPSESKGFMLTEFNKELKDEIRVETTHGVATYSFKILGGYPQINRVQCAYPRKAGDILNVYGLNLEAIESIYFTDVEAAVLDTTTWEIPGGNHVEAAFKTIVADHKLNTKTQVFETTSQLEVEIPELPFDKGTFVIEAAAGTTYIAYSKTPGMPLIFSTSSDMPVLGQTLTIQGREFVQVESITYGDVVLEPGDFTIAETEDAISFTFSQIPSAGSDPNLFITTPGGTVSTAFYDTNSLLVNFDDVAAANNGWGPDAIYEEADGVNAPFTSSGTYARIKVKGESGPQWWGTMVFYKHDWEGGMFPLPENIPNNAPASDVYLAMEVYDNFCDYNNDGTGFSGFLRYTLFPTGTAPEDSWTFDNFDWEDYDAGKWFNKTPILADLEGEAHKGQWYRHVLPLSSFAMYEGLTYGDIKAIGLENFRIQSINQHTVPGDIDVCIDNIRIIYITK